MGASCLTKEIKFDIWEEEEILYYLLGSLSLDNIHQWNRSRVWNWSNTRMTLNIPPPPCNSHSDSFKTLLFCWAAECFSLSQYCLCCMHILLIFSVGADHIHWNEVFFFFKEWFKKFLHFCSLLLQCGKCVFGFHCKVSKSDVTGGRDSKAKNCFKLNRQSGLKSWG